VICSETFKSSAVGEAFFQWLISNNLIFCHDEKKILTPSTHHQRQCNCEGAIFALTPPIVQPNADPPTPLSDVDLFEMLQLCLRANQMSCLNYLPKRTLIPIRKCFADLLTSISQSPYELVLWVKFFAFPAVILTYPQDNSQNPTFWVKKRLTDWNECWWKTLLDLNLKILPGNTEVKAGSDIQKSNVKRCLKNVKLGRLDDALKCLGA
jgi:hypothetical protein